jgi:flavin reductase
MQTSFVSAMSAALTGVTVVTTDGALGRLGLTVSSMASVSASPPMLLVCIDRRSPLVRAVRTHGTFAVNVLGVHQAAVADTFAGRREPYDFAVASWEHGGSGAPLLIGAAARFECSVASTVEAGTHTIVVADVTASHRGTAPPLGYTRRGYLNAAGSRSTSRAGARR